MTQMISTFIFIGGFRQRRHVLAKPNSDVSMDDAMLDNSCTLGLFRLSDEGKKIPVGMASMITTLAYLTDIYVQQSCKKLGFGQWLIYSCRSIALEMSDLRFMVLQTGSSQAQDLFPRDLGMTLFNSSEDSLAAMEAWKAKLADAASVSGNGPRGPEA